MSEDQGDLGRRVANLEERVSRLERTGVAEDGPHRRQDRTAGAPPAEGEFWALEVLRTRSGAPFEEGDMSGSVLFAGAVRAPGAGEVVWQEEHPLPSVLRGGWSDAARALSALAHPVRLELVRRLLAGARTASDLAAIPDLGTSGQLYHHLRELQAAGLVAQRRRNDYTVPADRVIPCLALVAAAISCAHVEPGADPAG